ncbi:hydrophobin-251 [Infundibulicybe gibba]|nr:hydrophobin-251 [Infundibulicybe gibba]
MFVRTIALAFLAFPLITAAITIPRRAIPASQCDTGKLQCCQETQDSKALSPPTNFLLGLLGVVLDGLTAQVGLTCSSIGVVAISGNSCSTQPVCCENNSFSGLVALGCTPVNINI